MQKSKLYGKKIKELLRNDWENIVNPIDLFINSQKDMEKLVNVIWKKLEK